MLDEVHKTIDLMDKTSETAFHQHYQSEVYESSANEIPVTNGNPVIITD